MSNLYNRYIIIGLGVVGQSVASFLANSGAQILVWDDNVDQVDRLIGAMAPRNIGRLTKANPNFSPSDLVIISPGVRYDQNLKGAHFMVKEAAKAEASIISALDLFKEKCKRTNCIFGVTGSAGKSTVTTMIHHLMQSLGLDTAMGGNIGIPYFDITPFDAKFKVLELSSYELSNSKDPSVNVGIITNLFPHHLDRHGDFEQYIESKLRIVSGSSVAVLNADDPITSREILPRLASRFGANFVENNITFFSTKETLCKGVSIVDGKCYANGEAIGITIPSHLDQEHNLSNLAACLEAIRTKCYLEPSKINSTLARFEKLEHRDEEVQREGNIVFINNSKSTSHISTAASLKALRGKVILIAGGKIDKNEHEKDETLNFKNEELKEPLKKVLKIFLIGEVSDYHAKKKGGKKAAKQNGSQLIVPSKELPNAVTAAYELAQEEAQNNPEEEVYILFSPGFTSFDQFKDFVHRGRSFKETVAQELERAKRGIGPQKSEPQASTKASAKTKASTKKAAPKAAKAKNEGKTSKAAKAKSTKATRVII